MFSRKTFVTFSLFALAACRTSRDIQVDRIESEEPTATRTIENPSLGNAGSSAHNTAIENLQRELAVAQGDLENERNNSQKERESLNSRLSALEEENKRLSGEIEKMKGDATASAAAATEEEPESKKISPEKLWEQARRLLREGEMKLALEPLETLRRRFPKDANVYRSLLLTAMAQYRIQNFKEAALVFNQAIDKFGSRKDIGIAWFGQGAAFMRMGHREDSKLFFEEAMKRAPRSLEAHEAKKLLKKKSKAPNDLFAVFSLWTTSVLK